MHRDSTHAFKVGLMVAIGLLVLAAFIFVSGDFRPFRPRYTLTIIFNHVAGLEVNSPVRLSGMEVGGVRGMKVKGDKISVVIWLDEGARIHQDAKASINSMGLIGEKYIELTMGRTGPYLKDGTTIIGEEPVSIGEMLARGEKVVQGVEEAVKALDRIFSETEIVEDVKKTIKNIESFSTNLDGLLKENKKGISDGLKNLASSSRELSEVTRELRTTTTEVSSRLKGVLGELDKGLGGKGKDIEETISNLKGVSTRLTSVMDSLANITRKIGKGEGTAGKIIFDEEMAKDLGAAVKDLKDLAKDLKANPWKLMKKK